MKNSKRFPLFFVFALTIAAALPISAGAAIITFNSAPVSVYGYGVGLYNGTMDGTDTLFVCDDFFTDIGDGQSWNANIGTTDPVTGGVLFDGESVFLPFQISGTIVAQQDYNMIGFLVGKIFTDPTTEWGVDSFALWSLNDQAAYTYAASQGIESQVSSLLSAAYAHKDVTSDLAIYTPVPWNDGQEFASQSTPEPQSWTLFMGAIGLIGIGTWRRKYATQ